jgi:hypothetical protein
VTVGAARAPARGDRLRASAPPCGERARFCSEYGRRSAFGAVLSRLRRSGAATPRRARRGPAAALPARRPSALPTAPRCGHGRRDAQFLADAQLRAIVQSVQLCQLAVIDPSSSAIE